MKMFLTPKVFNFSVYQSLEWPVRPSVNEFPPAHRVHVRPLPAIPVTKPSVTDRFQVNHLLLQSLAAPSSGLTTHLVSPPKKTTTKPIKNTFDTFQQKPRTITIIKHGPEKPHKTITILLNRRTIQTFEQLLSDMSEAFGYQKYRGEKIKRLYTLKGRPVNGIHEFFRDEEMFIASTSVHEISSADLEELNNQILSDLQHSPSRRHPIKTVFPSPVTDPETPVTSTVSISVDVKKTINIRDSGFLEDEENSSGKGSEVNSSQKITGRTTHSKVVETSSEDVSSSNELFNRKMKKPFKPNSMMNIEHQRERERQRLREEDERRRKRFLKKEQAQLGLITMGPKFERLAIDMVSHETPSTSDQKLKPIAHGHSKISASQPNLNTSSVETLPPIPKKFVIKKRSTMVYPSPSVVTDRYELGKKMGDGNFAIVRRSKVREYDREVAIKIIDKSKMKGKEYMLDHEINIMYMCNHANIIRLYEDYETADEIYLVMELIKGGDLFDYISRHRRFDERVSALMIRDVGEALLYLHAKKIVHRDLKPENLLVMQRKDGSISIKLTDFGLAMVVNDAIKTVCGTPTYVAPEILAETGYGIEVDCWATGIILYILLCGYPPFKAADRNQDELFQLIQQGQYTYDPTYWSSISANAKDLIDHLLVTDRRKRIIAEEILLHPWIISMGQSKPMRYTDEAKAGLRLKYEAKKKEYAAEG